ncbi:biotin/lipoyl-binding protein [Lysobacter sp. S4-A87]|uniref:HlyD family secretion protein n=1 Tax=Lysobacter sp. S4-A87 TaxID=2925843 RepID=UPI001F536FC1|nr:biotin/lipoyl-binding protein [Lysobacter sp. S4-A87]UNK49878.1 biotin/lipoyl-binding protein [Lysobacter sp. S4-A87]
MLTSLALSAAFFAYYVAADTHMPVSPDARLTYRVTRVAPEVSGRVIDVCVVNNQRVQRGDLLFRVDPDHYLVLVEQAQLEVEQATQDNAQFDAVIAAAIAELARAETQLQDADRDLRRFDELERQQYVSHAALDAARARRDVAAAQVHASLASLAAARVQRGEPGDHSLRLRRARNALDRARLDLDRSQVTALEAGIVSNLRLEAGAYAQAGEPKLALVSTAPSLFADFREKALLHVERGTRAEVAFDALPGRLFQAEVASLDAGVANGQIDPDGRLAAPEQSDRWVRDAERVRVNLRLLEAPPRPLMTGARATVQLHPREHGVSGWFGHLQIRVISLLHYVY